MNYCLITIQELVLIGEGKDKHFLIFNLRAGRRVECRLTLQLNRRCAAGLEYLTTGGSIFQQLL